MQMASSKGTDTIHMVLSDNRPLMFFRALVSLCRCMAKTGTLLWTRALTQPKDHVGEVLHFDDGSAGRVYRETVLRDAPSGMPVVLVVGLRLRWIRGCGHRLFRAESVLNTPLFV